MNSWLVKQYCKVSPSLLRQSLRTVYQPVAFSTALRHISSTAPSPGPAGSYSRVNVKPKSYKSPEWNAEQQQRQWDDVLGAHPTGKAENRAAEIWALRDERANNVVLPNDAYSGRTIFIQNDAQGTAVSEAWGKLSARLRRNDVFGTFKRNQRHEQKGAKRRRLESERWRKSFAHEVRKKIELVQAIRRRGA